MQILNITIEINELTLHLRPKNGYVQVYHIDENLVMKQVALLELESDLQQVASDFLLKFDGRPDSNAVERLHNILLNI